MKTLKFEILNKSSPGTYFEQIARIHKEEIEEGFLSTLGTEFLMILYKNIALSPNAFLIVATSKDTVVGFIACSISTSRFYRDFIFKEGFRVFPVLLPKLVSLKNLKKIFETLLYPARRDTIDMPESEILNFCVSNQTQRKGIGKQLFCKAIQQITTLRISQIKIITGSKQFKAQRFYENMGTVLKGETEIHKSVTSLIYVYHIDHVV